MPLEPYREFLAEREELLRHKWVLSEAAGRDVGFESALVDWAFKHRSGWRQKRDLVASVGTRKSAKIA